ncbi:uncharacterized protein PHACADRAFT_208338 [Phanerochaete carnosa HHB-10118-sp]|uniref:Phospholipase/carboxylesterase/thioesterase domain-containing protein n=1 Tax=Phanerochaete carnosa (strain HHB-10118-sp) TaxID=650164 RepID=K5X341_PHACS|nr:uncharacterized protein PHACADRAFT_208338 [Phanerochaete carnosa HHB-10118-sp]EKM57227.1 hypothetical protein PHACADRAFT_208338 [Phanerochaete carnosa HHB-10118-sp]
MTDITLREAPSTNISPKVKRQPSEKAIPVPFDYCPSDDGTDENLLILLHGLGDTHKPFGRLGRSLKLPQTATLALRAPELIPYLYEEAYQWYESFDQLGDLIQNPNPTPALALMSSVLKHLTVECAWPAERIHLFGFAQGGTVAAEFALHWWRTELERTKLVAADAPDREPRALASVVSVCGPLLSFSTVLARPCPTPVFVAHRPSPAESAMPPNALSSFKKGYSEVKDVSLGRGEGMPRSRDEWEPIMRFWSERLSRRQMEGLYEVMSGAMPL